MAVGFNEKITVKKESAEKFIINVGRSDACG